MCKIDKLDGLIKFEQHDDDVITLAISKLDLPQIPLEIGRIFPKLQALYIYEGSVITLTSNELQLMPNLRVFSIQNNTKLHLNDSNAFQHNGNLEVIRLMDNNLDIIDPKIFDNLEKLHRVRLDGNRCINQNFTTNLEIKDLRSELLKKCHGPNEIYCKTLKHQKGGCQCTMRKFRFIKNMNLRDIKFYASCDPANVHELTINSDPDHKSAKNSLPTFLFEAFTNLSTFTMQSGSLNVLEADHLKPANMLKTLDLTDNKIRKLQSDVFENAQNLEEIDLSRNSIESIGVATFNVLTKIKFCNLFKNVIANTLIMNAELINLNSPKINERGRIDDVLLCTFSDETFSFIDNVVYTCIAENTDQHASEKSDSFLGMDGKHIKGKGPTDLKAIAISNTKFSFLPIFLKDYFHDIECLKVTHGKVSSIVKENLENLSNLRHLDFSHNKIDHLDFDIFGATPKLEYVDFSHNKLSTMDFNGFGSLMKSLKMVGFVNNPCINLDGEKDRFEKLEGAMIKCASFELNCKLIEPDTCNVESEYARKNHLRIRHVMVENEASYPVANFKTLEIKDKKFWYLPKNLYEFMPNLEAIFIDNSQLRSIELESFAKLGNLKTLKITSNKVAKLSPEMFADNVNLTHLDLSNNLFTIIDSETFKNLTNLEFLGLSSNNCFKNRRTENHLSDIGEDDIEDMCKAWTKKDVSSNNHESRATITPLKMYMPWY